MNTPTISITALRQFLPQLTKKNDVSYILTYHSQPIGTIHLTKQKSPKRLSLIQECDEALKEYQAGKFVTAEQMKRKLELLS
jgi:hypothetical protein